MIRDLWSSVRSTCMYIWGLQLLLVTGGDLLGESFAGGVLGC